MTREITTEFTTEKIYNNVEKLLVKMNIFISKYTQEVSSLKIKIFWLKIFLVTIVIVLIMFLLYHLFPN